jgi:hypothetical protein
MKQTIDSLRSMIENEILPDIKSSIFSSELIEKGQDTCTQILTLEKEVQELIEFCSMYKKFSDILKDIDDGRIEEDEAKSLIKEFGDIKK